MIPALAIATAGMSAAASQAAAAAEAIAKPDTAPTGRSGGGAAPRVGYLPLPSDPLAALGSLTEAELAFKANAAVARTAAEMAEALYKVID